MTPRTTARPVCDPRATIDDRVRRTLEALEALLMEVSSKAGVPSCPLASQDAAWTRPLVALGTELQACVRAGAHPLHGAEAARAITMLVEGEFWHRDFTHTYTAILETRASIPTLHIRLVSHCIHLEWLFRRLHASPPAKPSARKSASAILAR